MQSDTPTPPPGWWEPPTPEVEDLLDSTQPAICIIGSSGFDDIHPTSEGWESLCDTVQRYFDADDSVHLIFIRY